MKTLRYLLTVLLLTSCIGWVSAQSVNTLYFLENAPMRHTINPAFQPVSKVYVGISPLSYLSLSSGNNALAMNDLIYKKDGRYITALYPGEGDKLADRLKHDLRSTLSLDMNLLNFGFRIKDFGYFHFGISEHLNVTTVLPGELYNIVYNSGTIDPNGREFYLDKLSAQVNDYTEFAAGYSHRINDKWSVGGKFKFILGHAFMDLRTTDLTIRTQPDQIDFHYYAKVNMAIPLLTDLPEYMDSKTVRDISKFINTGNLTSVFRPQGYGAAVDLGATYKPHPQVQISLAVTDLGFVKWNSATRSLYGDSVYTGPVVHYRDLNSNTDDEYNNGLAAVGDTIMAVAADFLQNGLSALLISKSGVNRMLNTRINVGVDGNFWDNRIGVGLYSSTQFRDRRVYEELTLGAALRPVNWFNMALSYSFINGRWNSMGLGLSFMPYDGLNFMLLTDYIPFTYADIVQENGKNLTIPYKMKGMNLAFGVTIVAGTNPKKADKPKQPDLAPKNGNI